MTAQNLDGKVVLLVVAKFFGYERAIAEELRARGAIVDMMADRPFDSAVMKAVARLSPSVAMRPADWIYERTLEAYGRSAYDIVLIVNGQTVSTRMLSRLRTTYPKARYVLYMWDSFNNRRHVARTLNLFDRCFTFDPLCAKKHNLVFRPLFFSKGFKLKNGEPSLYDLSFIGTIHTDRYKIISTIDHSLPKSIRRFWYFYLHAHWVYYLQRSFNPGFSGSRKSQFEFKPLPSSRVQEVFNRSSAILDIEHPNQTGLTIRSLETVGAGRKLITTNKTIVDYDFYDPTNILVIDRVQPVIPADFLHSPYKSLKPQIYRKYSIEGWMDDILSP